MKEKAAKFKCLISFQVFFSLLFLSFIGNVIGYVYDTCFKWKCSLNDFEENYFLSKYFFEVKTFDVYVFKVNTF